MIISIHGLRVEPDFLKRFLCSVSNISIHGLRVEPDKRDLQAAEQNCISIHGLRVEPDPIKTLYRQKSLNFNPRAPCGARHSAGASSISSRTFQSTGSVWSPTQGSQARRRSLLHFNPRAPCGARHGGYHLYAKEQHKFQSTGSVWSPTFYLSMALQIMSISIHGLRVEPDSRRSSINTLRKYFNPRAPCGARPFHGFSLLIMVIFQSTGSVWSPTR